MGTPSKPTLIGSLDLGSNLYSNTLFYYGTSSNDGPSWPTAASNIGLLASSNSHYQFQSQN